VVLPHRALDIDDLLDDEETRQYVGEGKFILVTVKFINVV